MIGPPEPGEALAAYVKRALQATGWTVRGAGAAAGLASTELSMVTRGQRRLSEDKARRFARALGLDADGQEIVALTARLEALERLPVRPADAVRDVTDQLKGLRSPRGREVVVIDGEGGPPAAWEAHQEAQRQALAFTEARTLASPWAVFLHATDAAGEAGFADAVEGARRLLDAFGAAEEPGAANRCLRVELFPLTRAFPPRAPVEEGPTLYSVASLAPFVRWERDRLRWTNGELAARLGCGVRTVERALAADRWSAELTRKLGEVLVDALVLAEDEREYLELLGALSRATDAERAAVEQALGALRTTFARHERESHAVRVLGDWRRMALGCLPQLVDDLAVDDPRLDDAFLPPLWPGEGAALAADLCAARMLRVDTDGLLRARGAPVWVRRSAGGPRPDPALLANSAAMVRVAGERLATPRPLGPFHWFGQRHLHLSDARADEWKDLVRQHLDRVFGAIAGSLEPRVVVLQLNVTLAPTPGYGTSE